MAKNSRAKGRRAERDVAKLLAKWWRKIDKKVEFKPTPLSGGWGGRDGGKHVRAHFKASGDLMTTSVSFPFTIEVKHREAWSMRNLVAGRATPVWDWWVQSQRQSEEEGEIAMLWFRKNNFPWMVALPPSSLPLVQVAPGTWSAVEADLHIPASMLDANGVPYGAEVPSFILGERLLKVDPKQFAKEP
jgi:hypothetical protein